MIEIDESLIPQSLFVTDENGKKTVDFSKVKTIDDVNAALNAKQHVKEQLNNLKAKYKDIDIVRYNTLIAQELENNKDIIQNPLYKNLETQLKDLQGQYQGLQNDIAKRDAEIARTELKEQIRKIKDVEPTAVDDLLYRCEIQGFTKTEKGFLSKDGKNVQTYLSTLLKTAPHLFKRTVGLRDAEKEQNRQSAYKNNNLRDVLANCPTITR